VELKSSAFTHKGKIPSKYTYDGKDVSPPLSIGGIPKKAKSIAVVVDDPDAPMGIFDHWIAWNLSPQQSEIGEGLKAPQQGKNDFGELGYRGPCPPPGSPHRYFFKVYALDSVLELPSGARKQELEKAMEGHILDQAELIGLYQR